MASASLWISRRACLTSLIIKTPEPSSGKNRRQPRNLKVCGERMHWKTWCVNHATSVITQTFCGDSSTERTKVKTKKVAKLFWNKMTRNSCGNKSSLWQFENNKPVTTFYFHGKALEKEFLEVESLKSSNHYWHKIYQGIVSNTEFFFHFRDPSYLQSIPGSL